MRFLLSLFLFASVALAGCSSSAGLVFTPEEAEAALTEARARIEGAERLDAASLSPSEMREARLKLSNAEAALDAGNPSRAARLAREAAIDATLAETASLAQRAQEARTLSAEVLSLQATIRAENE